ncbi:MAG: SLBB domain-containing protein [Kiritimatiellae bacterium]|nr:SLBB domain-containing protein [Kiritimatiellia bacterium]MDD5521875.1 SLBB domain-containing protein [Kiritimatiellia bacterium]
MYRIVVIPKILHAGLAVMAVVFCFLVGCATHEDIDLSKLLKDLDDEKSIDTGKYTGPDAPEPPSSGLPPPPSDATGTVYGDRITIQQDCLVQVSVKEDRQLEGSYNVNEIGAIELGYVGPVILYNMTEKEAEQKIREVLESRYFRTATVRLKILKASYDKMMVLGAVNKPGIIKIGAGDFISLNDALLRAGGLRPAIKGARVKIVKGGLAKAVAFDGDEHVLVAEDGKPSIPDIKLRNNDVVYVFSSDASTPAEVGEKEVYVLGEIQKPGVYRFSMAEPCSMMHLLFKIGGLPPYANAKSIKIMRRNKNGEEQEIRVNAERILKEGKPEEDIALENGDRVVVPARRISLF